MMGQLEAFSIQKISDYYTSYMSYLHEVALKTKTDDLEAIIKVLLTAYDQDKTIYFIGNGGSAATASHFSEDLAEVGRKCNKKLFRCNSLTDNVSYITAAGNDYGYDKIFLRQLEAIFNPGDVLVGITASGNSPNVIEAVKYANAHQGRTIGLLGFDGGKAKNLCHFSMIADTNKGEYGPAEDMHMIMVHLITSYLYFELKKGK